MSNQIINYTYDYDPYYCYENSSVLINKLNIKDSQQLNNIERKITALRTAQFLQNYSKFKLNTNLLCRIHKFLFNDIYFWAGKYRKVNISKGLMFCRYDFIDIQLAKVMSKLEQEQYLKNYDRNLFIERLVFYFGEINAIHPFREGNGRTQRLFLSLLSLKHGFMLDFSKISSKDMLQASIDTFELKYELLNSLFDSVLVEL